MRLYVQGCTIEPSLDLMKERFYPFTILDRAKSVVRCLAATDPLLASAVSSLLYNKSLLKHGAHTLKIKSF